MADVDPTAHKCSEVVRPTKRAEASLLLIIAALIAALTVALWALVLLTYWRRVTPELGKPIFILGVCAIAGLIVCALCFLSPMIGTMKLKAGRDGIDAEVDGKG